MELSRRKLILNGTMLRLVPATKFQEFQGLNMWPECLLRYSWPLAMQGYDVIGVAATGSGKTPGGKVGRLASLCCCG